MTQGADISAAPTSPPDIRLPRVRLTRLALAAFRNHRGTILRLDGRHVCLYGPNGAGKTNLLEAVSMLGPGKGLRSASLSDITLKGPDSAPPVWALSADLHDGDVDRKISVALEAEEEGRARRVARLDGAAVGQGDLAELVRIIWLTPSMDRVFAGAAGDRRRFFDRQVLAHSPGHGPAAAAYEKAMRQRNALLEQVRPDPAWLDALEQKMAEAGAAMAVFRAQALERMQAAIDRRAEGLFPKADLALDGAFERMAAASADLNRAGGARSRLHCARAGRGMQPRAGLWRAFTGRI